MNDDSQKQNEGAAPPADHLQAGDVGRKVQGIGFVQTERASHQAWGVLSKKKPTASSVMHHLTFLMDNRGAVVISQKTLAKITGYCERAVRTAIKDLESLNWIQVVSLGPGTTCAYVINDRVAWADKRENMRFSKFSAAVIADVDEQSEKTLSSDALRKVPVIYSGEIPVTVGDYEPPCQVYLEGMEPDLPSVKVEA